MLFRGRLRLAGQDIVLNALSMRVFGVVSQGFAIRISRFLYISFEGPLISSVLVWG
jgi:hypothetical protein